MSKKIKVVSLFVSLFLQVEIIRVIWHFVVCSELCSIVLEIKISIRKRYVLNMGLYFPVEITSTNFSFVFLSFYSRLFNVSVNDCDSCH